MPDETERLLGISCDVFIDEILGQRLGNGSWKASVTLQEG